MVTPGAPVASADEDVNPLIQEARVLNEQDDASMTAEIAALDRKEEAEGAAPTAPPALPAGEITPPVEAPAPTVPPSPGLPDAAAILQRQLQEAQARIQQFETHEQELTLDREVDAYRVQLEQQGLGEEQALPIAQQYKQFRQREIVQAQQVQIQQGEMLGKFYAALHYGKLHGVEPTELLQYNSPREMETAAQNRKEIRELKAQVQKLTQRQVPASVLETGQPAPVGGRGEGGWLTAYNNGDRSPQAVAAAQRAAGR